MVVELKLYSSSCPNPWLLPSCGGAAIEAKKYFTQDESMLSTLSFDRRSTLEMENTLPLEMENTLLSQIRPGNIFMNIREF